MSNWLTIFILFFSVLSAGMLTFVFKDFFASIKHYVTTVGVAFVLSLICVHILPEIFHNHVSNIGAYILLGFVFQIFLELFSRGVEHGHVHHNHGHANHSINRTLISMFFGLCIHSFIEGIPLFLIENDAVMHGGHTHSIVANQEFSKVFFWAILGHKVPVSIVLMLFLIQSDLKKRTVLSLFVLFASMSPLGGLVGLELQGVSWVNHLSTILLAVTTGMLIHITTLLVFEEYHDQKDKLKNIALIILGLGLGLFVFG